MRIFLSVVFALMLAGCSGDADIQTSVNTDAVPAVTTTVVETTTSSQAATTTTTAAPTTTSGSPSTTAAPTVSVNLPEGWNSFTGAFSTIATPPGWINAKELLNDPEARAAFVQEVQDQSADDFLDQLAPELLNIIDVFLFDVVNSSPEFVTNLNVIVGDAGPLTDLLTIEATIPAQLDSFGAILSGTEVTEIGTVETLVVDYIIPNEAGDVSGRQYHQIRGEKIGTVTFTSLDPDPDLWDQIMATARFATD